MVIGNPLVSLADQQYWRFGFPGFSPTNACKHVEGCRGTRTSWNKKSDSAIQDFILTPILPVSFQTKVKFSSFRQLRSVSEGLQDQIGILSVNFFNRCHAIPIFSIKRKSVDIA